MALRGSKVLARDDWMGAHVRLLHDTPQAVLDDLEAMHVDYVVLDHAPRSQGLAYWTTVRAALAADPAHRLVDPHRRRGVTRAGAAAQRFRRGMNLVSP